MRLIDVDAFIEDMKKRHCYKCRNKKDERGARKCTSCWVNDAIRETLHAPTAKAEPARHGEWRTAFVCSECGKHYSHIGAYCPNCGAKMDGGKMEK